jgi:hypothetical protein
MKLKFGNRKSYLTSIVGNSEKKLLKKNESGEGSVAEMHKNNNSEKTRTTKKHQVQSNPPTKRTTNERNYVTPPQPHYYSTTTRNDFEGTIYNIIQ